MLSFNGVPPKKSVLAQARRLVCLLPLLGMIGCGVTESKPAPAAVTLSASPTSVAPGASSMLTAQATEASQVVITGSDGSRYMLSGTGGTQSVTPTATTTYTATATGANGDGTSVTTVTVLPNPPAVTLSATPTSVAAGGSSTLTATATNAVQVLISGTDGSHYLLSPTGGAQSVTPTATTTYTATATGASGATVTATATVTVITSSATVTLSANPTSIAPSGTSTLTAAATNATQVVISGTDGSHYALSATGGTQVVTPTATTTYTATATGTGGNATANTTVTVTAVAPTVTLNASPTSVAPGGSSMLTASATNATQVVISGTDGSHYTLSATGGTQSVTPAATTTYTATATGPGGSTSANVTVTISATAPTVTLSANPTSVTTGGSSILTASASNATQVTVSGTDGSHYTLSPTGGTQSVAPATTTTYTATATGPGGSNSASATVTVTATAPTVTLNANPTSIASGGSSNLTASATNATQVTISGTDGSHYTLSATGGAQSVTPAVTTTYTATATGPGGTTSANTTVTVTAAAPTVTLNANPTSIASGASSTLTASATNATQVTISGTDGSHYTLSATGGTQSVTPAATTTYTATATGPGGTTSANKTVTVTAAAATVTLSANPTSIASGGSSTLTASAANATQVTISGTDGSSYTLSAGGGMQTVAPTATTTYTATATGSGGNATANTTVTVTAAAATVTLSANPTSIASGASSTLTATATNSTQVTISGTDGSSYTLGATGGTQPVSPTATTTYTATATSAGGNATAGTTITVVAAGSLQSINHVIFMLQENHSFDEYFGMLNNYRTANNLSTGDDGKTYSVDGIDDKLTKISNSSDEGTAYPLFKLTSTCVEDETSSWLESYGDVSRYDFTLSRSISIDGFVHTAENFAKNCQHNNGGTGCAGTFSDFTGRRAMGYYDGDFLNYYYYMASQFALSDRWFSPLSSKSIPNRIATFTGGTTQGLAFDPGDDDNLPQLNIPTILEDLTTNHVSWKIYYTVTQGACLDYDDCVGGPSAQYPATDFSYLQESYKYLYENPGGAACVAPTQASSVVGDTTNSFCIDPTHIAPLKTYYDDVAAGTLPSFSFIEPGYGVNDEHPGSGQSIFNGQQQVATVVNALMSSSLSWKDSVFFLSYDEGGGPYDHVPPVSGHSNDYTDATVGSASLSDYPDIASISVNPDGQYPCVRTAPGDLHCDLVTADPGGNPNDAPAVQGFRAQLGFRLPNMVISPFTRKHYVSHIPMDHTAILKFVENRFINASAHLTARDQAQPDLLDFFDFTNTPWATPPTPPVPMSDTTVGHNTCTPTSFGP